MTTGLTNCATSGDPSVQKHLCSEDAVASELGNGAGAGEPNASPNADSWRVEVSARLERYRTRRKPRTPRYPSLLLPFDSPESWPHPAPATAVAKTGSATLAALSAQAAHDFAYDKTEEPAVSKATGLAEPRRLPEERPDQYLEALPEPSAKVIEFPRSAAIPVFCASELADPIFDRPRIVEAPEILPPPPALGGMLMEPALQEPTDRRAEADFHAAGSASIARRALAAFVDGVLLATALASFAAIFLRLNPSLTPSLTPLRGPLLPLAGALGGIAVLLWMAYEFLFVVYTGSTPGLRAARLRLAAFDGSPLNRRMRRWRVLASFLSALSAGLGYFWSALDQDGLCWHDRITRSHVESLGQVE